MADYSKGTFISNEIINYFNKYWEDNQDKVEHIPYLDNVVNIKQLRLNNVLNPNILETQFILYDLVNSHNKNRNIKNNLVPSPAYYILEYTKDSFANIHVDSLKDNGCTTVILLHKSVDLSGGYILIGKKESSNLTSIDVVEQSIGEVMIYNGNTFHGVSKVYNGTRRVLITWFDEKE